MLYIGSSLSVGTVLHRDGCLYLALHSDRMVERQAFKQDSRLDGQKWPLVETPRTKGHPLDDTSRVLLAILLASGRASVPLSVFVAPVAAFGGCAPSQQLHQR
jgi:hypothetical protein